MARGPNIPVAPTGSAGGSSGSTTSSSISGSSSPSSGSSGSTSGGSSGGGGGGRSGGGSGGGGGGGGSASDPYGYRRKAAQRYTRQAENLQGQADALIQALRHEFGDALRVRLNNVNKVLKIQDRLVREGYHDRVSSLKGAVDDNEKAAASQTNAANQNRLREKNSAMSELVSQGAGESDALRAQQMSLGNWQANQSEVQRSQFDTLRTINSSLTDLNVDTKSARVNLVTQANADKESLWTNYYDRRQESLTQLSNVYGQQADALASAAEYGGRGDVRPGGGKGKGKGKDKGGPALGWNDGDGGKGPQMLGPGGTLLDARGRPMLSQGPTLEQPGNGGGRGGRRRGERDGGLPGWAEGNKTKQELAAAAAMAAANAAGEAWVNPGISDKLKRWDGRDEFEGRTNASNIKSMQTVRLDRKPEGASLRSWN